MTNTHSRDAKRILHTLHNTLSATPHEALPHIAKHLAVHFLIPQKTMLKAMARYTRIHHTN
jgi:hypothetical protein